MQTGLMRIAGVVITSLGLFAACGGGDEVDLGECPPNSEAQQQAGADLIEFSCTNFCHSESRTGEARDGAPEGMNFDSPEETLSYAGEIYESVRRTTNPMPPGGGMRADQIEDIRVFLACGTQP